MNTIEDKTKEIASWQCPDQYIPTDAVVTSTKDILLLNSSNYYYSMTTASSELTKVESTKELVKVEKITNDRYLVLTYQDRSYTCYIASSLALDGSAEAIDLGSDATEIAYNDATNSIWFVNTSNELNVYHIDSKELKKISDIQAKSVFLSEDNKYVAFENVEDAVFIAATDAVDQAKMHTFEGNSELLGATNDGNLIVLELGIAEKNASTPVNQLIIVKGTEQEVLLADTSFNWAVLQEKYIVAFDNKGKITLLELLNNG